MRLLGFQISRSKASVPVTSGPISSGWLDAGAGWWRILEPFTGAWQRNMEIRTESVLTYSAVYSCITLISTDISKMGLRLVEQDDDGIWSPVVSSAFSPVLRKPNRYQNRIKFIEQWVVSKLIYGNTYVLKERDARGVVIALYILDAKRTKPLVAPDGSVFYELGTDLLTGIEDNNIRVPASEIIHDTMIPLYHPLCGVSPIMACGLAAMQGISIQNNSNKFFQNGSRPGGVLTAPGAIGDEIAKRLKEHWDNNFTGENAGKVAVLGDGLKYEAMSVKAVDAQLIEQLKWTAETVCSCFHVPPYMIGVGPTPPLNNIEALNQQYYSQALQSPIECIELCLDEGLGLTQVKDHIYGTEFDLDDLLRMDTATKVKTAAEGLKGIFTPNEARKKFDLVPVEGGDAVYLQQQNFSVEALAKRDAKDDPFGTAKSPTPINDIAVPSDTPPADDGENKYAEGNSRNWAEQIRSRANALYRAA
jgi:HK97 family phage portal protein